MKYKEAMECKSMRKNGICTEKNNKQNK